MIAVLHGHHNCLISFFDTLSERIEEIKASKPPSQLDLRLRIIQEIPISELPPEVVAVWEKGKKAWETMVREYEMTRQAAALSWQVVVTENTWKECKTMWKEYETTCNIHREELEAMHKRLCVPDCPWDGKSIFPEREN